MAIATHEYVGVGKMLAKPCQDAPHDHGVLVAKRSLAGPQHGGGQSAGLSIEDHQRQIAGGTIVVVIERQWLLTIDRILRVIQIENQALWRTGKACNELLNESLADTVDVLAAGRVFEAPDASAASSSNGRQAGRAKLEHRVVAAIGVVAVLVTAANLVDPLRQEIMIRMIDVTLMTPIRQGSSDAFGQTNLKINAAQ